MKEKQKRIKKAKAAVKVRWDKTIPRATHGNNDKPLKVGDILLPCFVLEDGRRVLIQKNMATSMGVSDTGGDRIISLMQTKVFNKYISEELSISLSNPIRFKTNKGITAFGYDAQVFTDVCETILKARDSEENLTEKQQFIAKRCEILLRSFARVGLIALIDEATGYQEDRTKDALGKILEQYITSELRPWVKTFPLDYFKELCRLKDIPFDPQEGTIRLPGCVGSWTNNIIYNRITPGLLKELKKLTPKSEKGNKTAKYFQSLSESVGYKRLIGHLGSVVSLMKISKTYDEFETFLNTIHPICTEERVKQAIEIAESKDSGSN